MIPRDINLSCKEGQGFTIYNQCRALVSNVLSAHKDILITTDFVHFFRHIYEKYSPISKISNQFKLINEMCLRLKYRQRVNVNPKEILSYFIKFHMLKNGLENIMCLAPRRFLTLQMEVKYLITKIKELGETQWVITECKVVWV